MGRPQRVVAVPRPDVCHLAQRRAGAVRATHDRQRRGVASADPDQRRRDHRHGDRRRREVQRQRRRLRLLAEYDGSRNIYLAKSTDGGSTFGSPITVAAIKASSRKLSIPAETSGRKSRVYVSSAVYRTATKDLAFVVWADLSGESGCTSGSGPGTDATSSCKTRIWFTRSTDGGATWATPSMLNNQSGKNDQAFPRIAVDETDGGLMVVYYDTVDNSARLKTELFMQTSQDDGVGWSATTKVSSGQTDETSAGVDSGNQYGDYIGLHGHAGAFFPPGPTAAAAAARRSGRPSWRS